MRREDREVVLAALREYEAEAQRASFAALDRWLLVRQQLVGIDAKEAAYDAYIDAFERHRAAVTVLADWEGGGR